MPTDRNLAMSEPIRSARYALDQVASELDRHSLRGEYLPGDRMSKMAAMIRDAVAAYDKALTTPERRGPTI